MKKFYLLSLALFSTSVWSAVPTLNNVTQTELDNISKEFAANFVHTVVAPAKSLGHTWGFELGLMGGITETPDLEATVKRVSSSTTVDKIYHGGLLGMITIPWGITLEATFLPEKSIAGITVDNYSAGVKWTATDLYPISPWLDLAVRGHYSNSGLSYSQTSTTAVSVASGTISIDSSVWGANLTASSDILFFEPYVGVGFLKSDTDIKFNASGTGTIFATSVSLSGGNSTSVSHTSPHLFAGLQLDLLLFHLSAEYATAFGTSSYTGKLSFYF